MLSAVALALQIVGLYLALFGTPWITGSLLVCLGCLLVHAVIAITPLDLLRRARLKEKSIRGRPMPQAARGIFLVISITLCAAVTSGALMALPELQSFLQVSEVFALNKYKLTESFRDNVLRRTLWQVHGSFYERINSIRRTRQPNPVL